MKIGYVLKKFPRYSETFVLREVLALEDNGVPVQVFSLNPPRDGRFHASLARLRHTVTYIEEGLSRKALPGLWGRLKSDDLDRTVLQDLWWEAVDREQPALLGYLVKAIHIARLAREQGVTHLHAHFATSACEVARMASLLSGIPYSFTAHAKDIVAETVDREGLDLKFRDCRFAVTVCEANVTYLHERHPVSRGKLVRLYNGIDLQRWPAKPRAPRAGRHPEILAVGRFVPKKGFDLLVGALAVLAEEIPFAATILGDGELLEPIRNRVHELGLSGRVRLPGPASSEQVREAMDRADVLVCPSIETENGDRDALPTVLLEALAAGLPCVATPVGGIGEILAEGEVGYLTEPQPDILASTLHRCLTDPDAAEMALRGRRRAEALFDVHHNAVTLAELVEQTAAEIPGVLTEAHG